MLIIRTNPEIAPKILKELPKFLAVSTTQFQEQTMLSVEAVYNICRIVASQAAARDAIK